MPVNQLENQPETQMFKSPLPVSAVLTVPHVIQVDIHKKLLLKITFFFFLIQKSSSATQKDESPKAIVPDLPTIMEIAIAKVTKNGVLIFYCFLF